MSIEKCGKSQIFLQFVFCSCSNFRYEYSERWIPKAINSTPLAKRLKNIAINSVFTPANVSSQHMIDRCTAGNWLCTHEPNGSVISAVGIYGHCVRRTCMLSPSSVPYFCILFHLEFCECCTKLTAALIVNSIFRCLILIRIWSLWTASTPTEILVI